MQVLGVDIGLVHTGIAIIGGKRRCLWRGTINVEGDGTGPRFAVLREALDAVFDRVEDPACVAIEEPELVIWSGRDAGSILKLYGAFAVSFAEAVRHWPDARVCGVSPGQWKANVDKETSRLVFCSKYNVEVKNDHEADALGIADWAWDTALAFLKKKRNFA